MWEVIVGNVGTVYSGRNINQARRTFDEYVQMSKDGLGRVSNECVALMCGGEIVDDYTAPGWGGWEMIG